MFVVLVKSSVTEKQTRTAFGIDPMSGLHGDKAEDVPGVDRAATTVMRPAIQFPKLSRTSFAADPRISPRLWKPDVQEILEEFNQLG
jgi:hypothetical protein